MYSKKHGMAQAAVLIAALLVPLTSSGGEDESDPGSLCVLQVEKEAQVVVLADLKAPPPPSPMAYPLTELGDVKPGDLVRVHRDKGATLDITRKGDPECLGRVPKGDPHAHHRKNMKH